MWSNLWLNLFAAIINFFPRAGDVLSYMLPPALFNLSLTASIVILTVLVARLFLRKAPRVISYALWVVVAFRLICPVSFSSDFSLLNLLDAPVTESGSVEYVPVDIVHTAFPSVDLMIPEISESINEQLPQGAEQLGADPLEAPAALTFWIWLTGFSAMLLWALISYFNLRHKLRTAVLLENNIYQSEHVGSPFILGLFRPKIFIPFGLDETTLKYVLAHERYHIKRLDHIVKVFAFILLTVHWFNPLCWLAFHLMSKDMEMSCDEKVLSQGNNIKTEYSTILLSFAANRRFPSPSPLAFGETSAKSRIKNALKWKRPKVWVTILAAVLCIAIIAVCAANPKEETSNQDESPYEWTSTAQVDDLLSIKIRPLDTDVNYSINLSDERCNELFDILNNIPSDSIYPGRGIPAQLSVTIVQQSQTVYLNYGGDVVEISLLGASTDKIWEIHDDALNAFMDDCLSYAQSIYDEYIDNNVSSPEGLSLSVLSATQKGSASTLTLKLENLSGHAVSYGRAWGIECLSNPSWQDTPHSYTTELILLADGENKEYTLDRELPPGTYRIWKQVTLGTIDPLNMIDEFEKYNVSAFFTIGETVSQATAADQVQWEYAPTLSSVYPAFPFNINFYHVEATCSAGQLINRETGTKGSSMTYTFKNTLYWSPTTSDSINVPSATIEFTAHNAGDDRVYSGTIFIEQTASDSDSVYTYAARLLAGDELVLGRDIGGSAVGKVSRIPVHDLSADGKIELAAWRLSEYHFRTNSEKIYLDFERSEEPIEIRLYATDAEEPLTSFSTSSNNLASCSFSNLTSAREYYFAVKCDSNTLFTIHD